MTRSKAGTSFCTTITAATTIKPEPSATVRGRDESVPLVAAPFGLLEHRSDAANVELVAVVHCAEMHWNRRLPEALRRFGLLR
jgi:hypothetical protein